MVASPEYNLCTQAKIPAALASLHNFICIHDPDDDAHCEDDYADDKARPEQSEPQQNINIEKLGGYISNAEREEASARQDANEKAIWTDYQAVLAE
jgi:hypothetical protein